MYMIKLMLLVSQVPPYDVFIYEDMDSDEGEDSRLTDSDEEQDMVSRDAVGKKDSTLMVTKVELNKKIQDQAEKIKQLESTVELFLKDRDDRSRRMEEMLSTLLQQSSRKKRGRGS